ncbi:MAG: hypothetical protein WB562_06180 [Candidatus Sulfotelmatobacter sp.]
MTSYTNDVLGNLTQVVQNGSHTRTFTYDSFSRLLTSANPETGTITYTHNPDSTVLTKKDARLITASYTYDALHRETGVTYSNSDPALTFTYDETNCLSLSACRNLGHRTSMTDGAGAQKWAYQVDKLHFQSIHKEQRTNNSSPSNITKTTTYYLDLAGNVTQIVYPTRTHRQLHLRRSRPPQHRRRLRQRHHLRNRLEDSWHRLPGQCCLLHTPRQCLQHESRADQFVRRF